MSELNTVVKFHLVSPATNAVSKRHASGLHRVKDLHSTTTQRLNLLTLHVHKQWTDKLDLKLRLWREESPEV